MTKADEMNLENLMDNIRKIEEATKMSKNKNEIEKIRQFAISALEDYADTRKKICILINKNRSLFPKPYIKGSYNGFINGIPTTIDNMTYRIPGEFEFDHGSFSIHTDNYRATSLLINVGAIRGVKRRTGYCGAWEDHDMETANWVAEDIGIEEYDNPKWANDLVKEYFLHDNKRMSWSIENLKKYNFTIETWVNIKNMAENTRKRTEELIKRFRMCLEERINKATEKINKLEVASNNSVYIKVNF